MCANCKSETIYLPTVLANHFLNGTTGQLLIKENEFTGVLVSRALIFLVVNKTLIPSLWTTHMDNPLNGLRRYGLLTSLSSLQSFFFFLVNFSPALFYLNPWNSLIVSSPDQKNVPFIHF